MPGRACPVPLTVADILNKCQETAGAHGKYARMLWDVEKTNSDACFKELHRCLNHMLTTPTNSNANVERAFRFISTFTAQVPHREVDSCSLFIQDLVADLVLLSSAVDKNVRIRSCSLLAAIMQRLTVDLQDVALDELQEAMLGRLKDKVPQVRLHAAAALERLAEPGEDGSFLGDPVTKAYRRILSVERNKDVRKCILGVMPIVAGATLEDVIERTMDVSDAVRKQAFLVLANKCGMADLTASQRALLLRRGLRDRVGGVADAAKTLVQVWLVDSCMSDVAELLRHIDVHGHPEEAEQALEALEATKNLQLTTIACDARDNSTGLRSPPGSCLFGCEEAFFWRWACEKLHFEGDKRRREAAAGRGADADVKAAEAADCLQALEAALPESAAALMDLVASHAGGGAECGFAVSQLLRIAANCVDMSDASGRKAAEELLERLLQDSAWTVCVGWEQSFLRLAQQVHSEPSQLCSWLLEATSSFHERLSREGSRPQDWVQGLFVASLMLQQLPSLRPHGGHNPAAVLHELIFPALSKPQEVRAAGIRCLGLFCFQSTLNFKLGSAPSMLQKLPISLLRAAVTEASHQVRLEAARALCDLLLVRGPKVLDACHSFVIAHPSEYLPTTSDATAIAAAAESAAADAQPLLDLLLHSLSGLSAGRAAGNEGREAEEEAAGVGCVVAEGLAKLVMHQSRWKADSQGRMEESDIVRVLVRLLTAYVDPATEPATAARQCLSVFFPAYAGFSAWHHRLLSDAIVPAARRALGLPAKSAAPSLLRFCLQLLRASLRPSLSRQRLSVGRLQVADQGDVLQTNVPEEEEEEVLQDNGYSRLAENCLSEALVCPKTVPARPYIGALIKVAAGLPLKAASLEAVKALKVLAEHAKGAVGTGMAAKDAAGLIRRLAALDTTPSEPLTEEAIEEILERVNGTAGGECDEVPLFAAPVAPSTAARNNRRRCARRAAVVEEDTSEETDEDVDSDDEEGGGEKERASEEENERTPAKGVGKHTASRKTRAALQENVMSPTL